VKKFFSSLREIGFVDENIKDSIIFFNLLFSNPPPLSPSLPSYFNLIKIAES